MNTDEIKTAVRGAAWPDRAEDDTITRHVVHCFIGFLGADWNVEEVLSLIDRADSVGFGPDLFGHNLRVIADGRLFRFDVPEPVEVQS